MQTGLGQGRARDLARAGVAAIVATAAGACGLLLAAPSAQARIVAGVGYAGPVDGGGAVVFAVGRDGRRLLGLGVHEVPARCPDGPRTVDGDGRPLTVSRDGRFAGTTSGPASELSVRGRILAGGRATGSFTYSDRGDCSARGDFSARAERRASASGPLIFTLAGGYPSPHGLAELPDGSIAVAEGSEFDNLNDVRRIGRDGRSVRIAGRGASGSGGDVGPASRAHLLVPTDVAVEADGSLLIADNGNNCIRRVAPNGQISTAAGACVSADDGGGGFSGDGGPATAARLESPNGVAALPGGGFLFSEFDTGRVRKVSASGVITTVAGTGVPGFGGDGGPATAARLSEPSKVVALPGGGFLVDDVGNDRIRRVGADGTIATVAGGGAASLATGIGDGAAATGALLESPFGLGASPDGFVVADWGFGRVRSVNRSGVISTLAGGGPLTGDGVAAAAAQLAAPLAVLATREGGIVIADPPLIRYIAPRHTHWLLIALQGRSIAARHGRNAELRVVTTAAASAAIEIRRGRTRVRTVRFRVRRGFNRLRFGRDLRRGSYALRVTARSGGRVATAGGSLRVR